MDFTSLLVIPIVVLCLITGYIIKHVVSDEAIQNKWIPVIVTIEGIVVNVILCLCGAGVVVSAEAIVNAVIAGGISGASSTGFQSAFAAFIEKPFAAEDEEEGSE